MKLISAGSVKLLSLLSVHPLGTPYKVATSIPGLLAVLISGRRPRRLIYRPPDVKVRCPGNEVDKVGICKIVKLTSQ